MRPSEKTTGPAAPSPAGEGAARAGSGVSAGAALLLAGLTLVWGCNWPVMKIALAEAPVWWFRSGCVIAGGAGLLAISALTGQHLLPRRDEVAKLVTCAAFAIVGWHLFTGYGLIYMPAGRASIIAQTMPVWAAVFSAILLGERLAATGAAGLVLGMAGLALLIGPDIVVVRAAPIGALLMLGAAISWGLGTVLFKRGQWSTSVAGTTGWLLLIGAVPITAGALVLEPFPDTARFSTATWLAIAYVFLLPMIFGQWAFYRIVNLFSPVVAAISTMLVPVIGVISSALMIAEPVGERDLAALGLVSAALFSVLVVPALGRRRRSG